jgi:hypothetical protein
VAPTQAPPKNELVAFYQDMADLNKSLFKWQLSFLHRKDLTQPTFDYLSLGANSQIQIVHATTHKCSSAMASLRISGQSGRAAVSSFAFDADNCIILAAERGSASERESRSRPLCAPRVY